jgi:hypothetical protein
VFVNWIPISYSLYPIYFKFSLIAIWDFLLANFSLLCNSNAFGTSKFSSYFDHVWKNQVVRCGGLWWDGRTIGEMLIINRMMVVHIIGRSVWILIKSCGFSFVNILSLLAHYEASFIMVKTPMLLMVPILLKVQLLYMWKLIKKLTQHLLFL